MYKRSELPPSLDGAARRLVVGWLCPGEVLSAEAMAAVPPEYWGVISGAAREYLEILEKEGKPVPPTPEDIKLSGLLGRLFSGKAPLAQAPPLSDRAPWYGLVDEMGPLHCRVRGPMPLSDMPLFDGASPVSMLEINGEPWEIEAQDHGGYVVRWRGSPSGSYRTWPDPASEGQWWIASMESWQATAAERSMLAA